MVDAFQGDMDLASATWFINNSRKDGLIAVRNNSEIIGCNFLTPSSGNTLHYFHANCRLLNYLFR